MIASNRIDWFCPVLNFIPQKVYLVSFRDWLPWPTSTFVGGAHRVCGISPGAGGITAPAFPLPVWCLPVKGVCLSRSAQAAVTKYHRPGLGGGEGRGLNQSHLFWRLNDRDQGASTAGFS